MIKILQLLLEDAPDDGDLAEGDIHILKLSPVELRIDDVVHQVVDRLFIQFVIAP